MRILIGLVAAVTLAGCGASSSVIGPRTYQVNCRRSRANCWEEAQRVCPNGFTQLDGADHTAYIVSSGSVIPAYKAEMIVKCTGPEPVVAQTNEPAERQRSKRAQPRR